MLNRRNLLKLFTLSPLSTMLGRNEAKATTSIGVTNFKRSKFSYGQEVYYYNLSNRTIRHGTVVEIEYNKCGWYFYEIDDKTGTNACIAEDCVKSREEMMEIYSKSMKFYVNGRLFMEKKLCQLLPLS
jgi:hypothetical protein